MMADAERRSRAEWVTTAICLALIALLCGAIIYEGYAASDDDPARIEITVSSDEAEQRGEVWYLPFAIQNLGDETVEEVVVVVELLQGEEAVAEAETTVMLLGESERVLATAVFENDPRPYTAEGRARSFQIAEDL
jgi:uncharacterized protein (TIGR02588 family)